MRRRVWTKVRGLLHLGCAVVMGLVCFIPCALFVRGVVIDRSASTL